MSDSNLLNMIFHIYNSVTILNFGALFTDCTPQFVTPAEPKIGDTVTIKFRTARHNVDGVDMILGEERFPMKLTDYNSIFDYYSVELPKVKETLRYYFEIHNDRLTVIYNRLGVLRDVNRDYDFQIVPGFIRWMIGTSFRSLWMLVTFTVEICRVL